ncbi:LacI family transcriptional regulator [Leptotrichia sp. OH3620_COT-345]|uniref:LacI family DNA-binding transcriptional regulator n=1 Tax=Leptotrichia sp. OH3620_COT-345 TaxID=2491048 RepID=UPI000F648429|nr:LacI family DNA-binding transcriptional regulator [Leptotrichia sp. OH3620_COT-345]RRD40886.1 LacI family transcriptional regulator [Leptotrichia sp. OH3620_COT-345]
MKIQDIAKLANVSVATVSRVINNNENVKEETRKKINKIIKENNYYPNLIARNLSKNENNIIGVILPDIKNLYFASIMNEIVNEANTKGMNIILGCSNESFKMQKKYIELFLEQRVKGIIIAVTQNSYDRIDFFEQISSKIPLVFIDRKINSKMPGVFFENFNSSYEIIEKFIKNNKRKIAFLAGPQTISTAKERLEGYKKALSDYNIGYDEKLVLYGDFTLESGYNLGKKILKNPIDAIYISNNSMTLGFLKAMKELNINSREMKIATFEDNEIIKFIDEKIISYDIPFLELSRKGIDILENLLENKKMENNIVEINL